MKNSKTKLFFILGCQRAGTTLMRLILESHSKVTCYDEPSCYELLRDYNKILSIKSKNRLFGFKTPLITEQMNEPFFCDVSLDFLIQNYYQSYQKILIIRDVRDTVSSMMTLKQGTSTWFDLWPKKSIEFWINTIPDFKSKFSKDLKKISKSKNKSISSASFYWKYKTGSLFDYEGKSRMYPIKYEDLVLEPLKTIQGVVKFLKLKWEEKLMLHHKQKHNFTDKKGITVGNTNTTLPIFRDSVGRYQKQLSKLQLEEITNIAGDLMEKLGYKI